MANYWASQENPGSALLGLGQGQDVLSERLLGGVHPVCLWETRGPSNWPVRRGPELAVEASTVLTGQRRGLECACQVGAPETAGRLWEHGSSDAR